MACTCTYSNLFPMLTNFFEQSGWTALMYACDRGYCEIVEILVAKGADPNQVAKVHR